MLASLTPHTRQQTEQFEELLGRCERLRPGGLGFDELRQLGRLYRLHVTRLARLQEADEDPEMLRHLNALCVRAYTFLYAAAPAENAPRPWGWSLLPDLLSRTWRAQAVAWTLLLVGILIGAVLGARDPDAVSVLVPESMGYSGQTLDELMTSPAARERFLTHRSTPAGWNVVFGSALFVHNTRIGLLSFATGMLAGIPTVLLQLYNGVLVGAFASIFLRDSWPLAFLAWILPHGIPELTAVTLCATGGLLLGEAVAVPGRRGRRGALRVALQPALLLFLGALPLFAIAALLESFIRESDLGPAARLSIAAVLGTALIAGLICVRRLAARRHVDTSWLKDVRAPARSGWRGSD